MTLSQSSEILRSCGIIARELGAAAPIKVLLVDDSEDYCALFSSMLKRVVGARYEVDCVTTFDAAVDTISRLKHDIYVIDLGLSAGRTGLDLIHTLQEKGLHFPFVVMTGAVAEDDRPAMGRDCMAWMSKTAYVSPDELDRALRYALKNWHTRKSGSRLMTMSAP